MREQHEQRWGRANWITAVVMLLAYLLLQAFAPALSSRTALLIALAAGLVSSVVIYLIKKRKKEKEEENKLPPI